MKFLIVSDSHGECEILRNLVEQESPDVVLHLGDYIADAQKLSLMCRETEVEAVPGNCDGLFWRGERSCVLSYEGIKLFLTHGHEFYVKSGLSRLEHAGSELGADAILFGHTHQALVKRNENGVWIVNPGSVGGIHAPITYVIGYLSDGSARFELKMMEKTSGRG